jgi:hypothetical protein
VAAVLVATAAACSSNATTVTGSATTTAQANNIAHLRSELLTVRDLPAGWAISDKSASTANDASSSDEPSCFKSIDDDQDPGAGELHAKAEFHYGHGVPLLLEDTFQDPRVSATALYALVTKLFSACKDLSITDKGKKITGTIGVASPPRVGDQSSAYALTFPIDGLTLGIDLLIARKGDAVMLLLYGGLGKPMASDLEPFAAKAVDRITPA